MRKFLRLCRDSVFAVLSLPIVVLNHLPVLAGKALELLDSRIVESWASTAALLEARNPLHGEHNGAQQLRDHVMRVHRVGPHTPAKVEPLVKPATAAAVEALKREAARAEGVLR